MNKNVLFFFILLLHFSSTLGQTPTWTNHMSRNVNYPETEYLVGFLSENHYGQESEEVLITRLKNYSRDQLAESILVDIKSISTLNIHNINAQTHEEFKRKSTSVSNATIAGLKTETYYDSKKKIAYAFSYAKKEDVINYYSHEIARELDHINTQSQIVKNQIAAVDNEKAIKTLYQLQTSIKNIEQSSILLITLTGNYNHPAIKRDQVNTYKINIDNELRSVRNTDQFKLDDAAFFIAYALNSQLEDNKETPIRVNNFTYQDTPMSSLFSRRMKSSLEQKLSQLGFQVANEGSADQNAHILNGNYWEESDRIKISTLLRNQTNSLAIASADCFLPKSTLDINQITYKPENYQEALVSMQQFAQNEITGGGLILDVFTNKGADNLIFTNGEEMKLFVKANRECYLRFIYHLADGSKVLLLNDYYISREYANKAYELPDSFECTEPFGFETLQLNAQSTPFEPLQTRKEYGYDFIIENNEAIIQKTRGFKKSDSSETLKAEKRLMITTLSN